MKPYTRWIDREYNRLLLINSKVSNSNGDTTIDVDPNQAQIAQDHLVKTMFDKTQEEVDAMTMQEYDECLQQIEKEKNPQLTA